MEPGGNGATWTGSPKRVFKGRKHHKPRLSLNNNTAGAREGEDINRTREAGNRDEVEGVVADTPHLFRNRAVGFIDWLDVIVLMGRMELPCRAQTAPIQRGPHKNTNWRTKQRLEWHLCRVAVLLRFGY
jgi:hypothetical protein